jgi:hypothetical protein
VFVVESPRQLSLREMQGVGFRVWSLQGVGFRVWSLQGVGFRVWSLQGVGFRVCRRVVPTAFAP